ncbi:MAG: B12-binding domain-containing radical SAM protein, partial [Methanosarcinales archaeon]
DVIDTLAEEMREPEFLDRVKNFSPDLVVMECSTPSINIDYQNAKKVKEITDSKIVFVGNHSSALPKEVLKNESVDFALIGEYDYTLRDLVLNFDSRKKYSDILGLAFKDKNKIHVNKIRPLIKNLDELPLPARHLFKMEKYNETFCEHHPNIQILTSRGCPYNCIFCIESGVIYGPSYRARSVPLVLEEIKMLIDEYKPKEIYFDDSTFTVSEKRTIELCDGIIKNGFDIPWSCMTTSSCIRSEEMLEKMRKAGCERIKIGLESADENILKQIGKPYNLEHVRKALGWAKELGIGIHLTFMIGLPGETKESIKNTMKFIQSLAKEGLIFSMQTSIATPFPGTKFYEMALKNNWLTTENWASYDGCRSGVISYPQLTSEEIIQLKNEIDKAWKYSTVPPSLLFKKTKRLVRQRGIFPGSVLAFKRAIDYLYHKIAK